jgi:branched-chain amino acid transport system ATP-binding protein
MTAADRPALEVTGISKSFGGLHVLREVSFSVGEGEIVGLMGPNGAGKSTLFEIIGGGLRADGGSIRLFGQDITRTPPYRRRRDGLARTFQKIRLFNNLTVEQNVEVASNEQAGTVGPHHDTVDDILGMLRLGDKRGWLPPRLSLADRKRLEIARAIAGNCRLLLLDESLSGLTHDEAEEVVDMILRLNAEKGVTIVLVEHVMSVVMKLVRRLVVLNSGGIIASGTPEEIVQDRRVIEAYLGSQGAAR